jgi:hypothetical protein
MPAADIAVYAIAVSLEFFTKLTIHTSAISF